MLTLQVQRFSVWSVDPTASVLLSGNLLQMCVLKPQTSPAYSKALDLYSSSLCFNKLCNGCAKSNSCCLRFLQFVLSQSVQLLSRVWLFVTPWIAARQASLSITNSWSLLNLMSIKSVMPSSHLILCCPLLLLPPIPPSIRVFSNESTLRMRWPKY